MPSVTTRPGATGSGLGQRGGGGDSPVSRQTAVTASCSDMATCRTHWWLHLWREIVCSMASVSYTTTGTPRGRS
jgi:hypothetical protein